jgi:hypothetical protein
VHVRGGQQTQSDSGAGRGMRFGGGHGLEHGSDLQSGLEERRPCSPKVSGQEAACIDIG